MINITCYRSKTNTKRSYQIKVQSQGSMLVCTQSKYKGIIYKLTHTKNTRVNCCYQLSPCLGGGEGPMSEGGYTQLFCV